MADVPTSWVITGSLTDEGAVAYLRDDGSWSPRLADAHAFPSKEDADARLAQVRPQEHIVTEPYAFEVDRQGAALVPKSARERIRSEGPTVRLRRPDAGTAS